MTTVPTVRRSQRAAQPTARAAAVYPQWLDITVLIAMIAIAGWSLVTMIQTGTLSASLTADAQLSWHISRATGLIAYALLAASTIWGVLLTTRVIKDWAPGTLSMLLHASASWLAVVMMFVHVGMLLFDKYYNYSFGDLLVPFTGPYRPLAVGLGTIAAWLTLAITVSYSVRRVIGQRAWRWLHYTSYASFALVTLHSLMAGTDTSKLGMWVVMSVTSVIVAGLLIFRVKLAKSR